MSRNELIQKYGNVSFITVDNIKTKIKELSLNDNLVEESQDGGFEQWYEIIKETDQRSYVVTKKGYNSEVNLRFGDRITIKESEYICYMSQYNKL